MLLQLAAQSRLIWELNNQPMAKRGKGFTIGLDLALFAGLRSSRPKICRPKFYHAQQHSDIPITHFLRLFRFIKV